jgi:hypothetical protein
MNDSGASWLDTLLNGASTGLSDIGSVFSSLERLGQALINPETYIRAFMVVFGLVLMLAALKY